MKENNYRILVTASMLAAMTCIATMIIKVPTIGTGGYVNIGDSVVLISSWMLSNPFGALSAGIGSALADLLSGYVSYAPATAIIKFAMAFASSATATVMIRNHIPRTASYIVSGIVAELIMTGGYFLYEATILGYGLAASASIVSNCVQGLVCLILGNLMIVVLSRIRPVAD